ncbi:TPA: hypothetical protein ACNRRD_006414 [Pseudomonas aeruginosa]|uniref:hypothetical protein n=1 Tax=Pseudomonas TaxID=286 RepID=UPI0003BAFC5F|nr:MULTISPECIES: hypothetical protein [Pseudomonas]AWT29842.1 hypothetical protein DCS61_12390 [Pseudomonas aeruginosa]ERZ12386.1 hypothetical protein Q008_04250 [Pseudomonas aeruginosa JJ692]ETD94745.1 hypothetical protein V527_01620 [Pseudomonas aeruginosa VRFPA06]KSG54764.1 hypothetical protein AO950_04725 [Pseudomonas aeruginosa]KSG85303.1 hypothetical protein AO952_07015 [Pseudomonas aeruginosa]
MCLWLAVTVNGECIDCATDTDELAAAIGCQIADLVSMSGDAMEGQQCLCDLDTEKTALKFGFSVNWAPEFGEVEIFKVTG